MSVLNRHTDFAGCGSVFFLPCHSYTGRIQHAQGFLFSMRDQHRPLKHFDLVIDDYLKVVFVKKVDF